MIKILIYIYVFLFMTEPSETQKCRKIKADFNAKVMGLPLNTSIATSFKECYKNCLRHPDCQSVNFHYIGTSDCHLMNYNVHENPTLVMPMEEWLYIENKQHPCNQFPNPCVNGGICQRDPLEYQAYRCVCPGDKKSGKRCQLSWVKINTAQVCYGAAGDSFGSFIVPAGVKGQVDSFKLSHISGTFTVFPQNAANRVDGYWGCSGTFNGEIQSIFQMFVTNSTNYIYAPRDLRLHNSKILNKRVVIRVKKEHIFIEENMELRLWVAQDLVNYHDNDNQGNVCADVYAAIF